MWCEFAVLCLVHVSMVSSLITNHTCAYFNSAPKFPFDKLLYAGQWFTYQLHDFESSLVSSVEYDCYVQLRTPLVDGNQELIHIFVNPDRPRLQYGSKLTFDQPGKGHFIYSSASIAFTLGYSFDILETDYLTYAIEFHCADLAEGGSDYRVRVLTRLPVTITTTQINGVLDKHHIDKTKLRTTSILSCPTEFLKKAGGGGLLAGVGGLLGGVLGLVAGLIGLVVNLLGGLLGALLG